MKKVQPIDLGMTGYDELFMDDEERKENALPRIFEIPIELIDDFPDHPFQVRMDEDMQQLVESVKERGLITPVILRKKDDDRYEIVSGHRRKKACEMAGMTMIKAEVRDMTRDEAIITMVDSNLQRSQILPSEKAHAYKMRLDAMKRLPGRPSIENGAPVGPHSLEGKSRDTGGMIQITRKMADTFGYDEKEIMKAAIAGSILNSKPGLYRIEDVLFGGDDKENLLQTVKRDDSLDGILVLTYRDSEFGAASLFFPGMQMRISEVIGDRDYYVLPSSVHELLVLPEAEVHSAEELGRMVQSVNAGMVAPDERLGDKVLYYRADLDRLSVAVNLEKDRDRERER